MISTPPFGPIFSFLSDLAPLPALLLQGQLGQLVESSGRLSLSEIAAVFAILAAVSPIGTFWALQRYVTRRLDREKSSAGVVARHTSAEISTELRSIRDAIESLKDTVAKEIRGLGDRVAKLEGSR